jgi:hypothetical protein
MAVHICYSAMKNCINNDSYGMICVGCNACGRINPERQREDALKMWKRKLQEELGFDNWIEGMEEAQRKTIELNIQYFKNKIAELES